MAFMQTFGNAASSMLGAGYNIVSTILSAPQKVYQAGVKFTSSFFPSAQKTTVTPSVVSNQPYTTYQGYRPQTKDATTTGAWYQTWWNQAKTLGGNVWNNVTGMTFKAEANKIVTPIKDTLASVLTETTRRVAATLPDYFMQKWGLEPRPATGEKLEDKPINIIYTNPTQTAAPAVTDPAWYESIFSLLGLSQPKGTYSIAYPQSGPIPTSMTNVIEPVEKQASNTLWIVIAVGVLIVGGIIFLRRK